MNEDSASAQMPRYQSHKKVWALEIKEIRPDMPPMPEGSGWAGLADHYLITPADAGYAPLRVEGKVFSRYMPVPGDFYVVYDDGYKSVSPRAAFLDGYTKI